MLLESFQIGVEEAHNAIDFGINPHPIFLSLNVDQTQLSTLLREATKGLTQLKHILIEAAYELDTYYGFETYTQVLATLLNNKKEISHG